MTGLYTFFKNPVQYAYAGNAVRRSDSQETEQDFYNVNRFGN